MTPLVVITPSASSHPFEKKMLLVEEPMRLGRLAKDWKDSHAVEPENGFFDTPCVSRSHAMIWFEGGTFWIVDTKSSTGTFLNDKRIGLEKQEIKFGDEMRLGYLAEKQGEIIRPVIGLLKMYVREKSEDSEDTDCGSKKGT